MMNYKARMYEDYSIDERYCYDVFYIAEDEEEEFLNRFFYSTLQEVIDIIAEGASYELEDDPYFEDWCHIYINEDIHYRIQLFQ